MKIRRGVIHEKDHFIFSGQFCCLVVGSICSPCGKRSRYRAGRQGSALMLLRDELPDSTDMPDSLSPERNRAAGNLPWASAEDLPWDPPEDPPGNMTEPGRGAGWTGSTIPRTSVARAVSILVPGSTHYSIKKCPTRRDRHRPVRYGRSGRQGSSRPTVICKKDKICTVYRKESKGRTRCKRRL